MLTEVRSAHGFNCTDPAINDFPSDGFTKEERQGGWWLVHATIAAYLFIALTIICDQYLVPSVERLCYALKISPDVAGATFMAAATSAPEFFVNIMGTFVTEGDLGIGTIVGSAVFNTLGVTAISCIVSGVTIQLDWYPLTRDCLMYTASIISLIFILWDSIVMWFEALFMMVLFVTDILLMCFNRKMHKWARDSPTCAKCFDSTVQPQFSEMSRGSNAEFEGAPTICTLPRGRHCFFKFLWVISYPINFLYYITIPDCRRQKLRNYWLFSFAMSIFWLSILSYLIAWMITGVGDTFNIPDSVMGITFIAAGTSIPEAVSSIATTKQGYGSMAIGNSIGSNTFDILVCLGIPWVIKTCFLPTEEGKHQLLVNSSGLTYITMTLLTTLLMLYLVFVCTKFTLGKMVGYSCFIIYIFVVIFAVAMEMNVFFYVNPPICDD